MELGHKCTLPVVNHRLHSPGPRVLRSGPLPPLLCFLPRTERVGRIVDGRALERRFPAEQDHTRFALRPTQPVHTRYVMCLRDFAGDVSPVGHRRGARSEPLLGLAGVRPRIRRLGGRLDQPHGRLCAAGLL